jgi:hypothetical protein
VVQHGVAWRGFWRLAGKTLSSPTMTEVGARRPEQPSCGSPSANRTNRTKKYVVTAPSAKVTVLAEEYDLAKVAILATLGGEDSQPVGLAQWRPQAEGDNPPCASPSARLGTGGAVGVLTSQGGDR